MQDAVKANGKLLKELLQHPNSHIYVCGDSNMAHAVSASFAAVIGGHTTLDKELSFHVAIAAIIGQQAAVTASQQVRQQHRHVQLPYAEPLGS